MKSGQKYLSIGGFKNSFAGIFLVANTFIWFLYSCRLLSAVTVNSTFSNSQVTLIWSMTVFGTVVASVFGFYLSNMAKTKETFIRYWLIAGIFLSLLPIVIDPAAFSHLTVFFSLVGVYFGLGMPVSLAYFALSTKETNRSRLGGVTFLAIFIGVIFLGVLGITDTGLNGLVLATVKTVGLAVFLKIKPNLNPASDRKDVSYGQVFKNKTFLLYFVPWTMFSIANYIALPIVNQLVSNLPGLFETSMMVENIIAGVFAVVSGFLADRFGRRRIVLLGFILLGLGYASLGLFAENIIGWWFYTAVDGVAWGIFYTIFLMTIWGDIAFVKNSEKYYAIGYLPFLFSILTELSIGSAISTTINSTAIFSFTSLFLFIAVLPLAYAPETLPLQILKNRELQSYIKKAQRAKDSG
ncbi:MAG: MFS transporter [Candidatus Bathyarchaeia archaeon]